MSKITCPKIAIVGMKYYLCTELCKNNFTNKNKQNL